VITHDSKHADPADYNEASCGPELPHDTAEDVFLDARCRVAPPAQLAAYRALLDWWSLEVFKEFWRDYDQRSALRDDDEVAIRILQTLSGSFTRHTAMKAECLLAVVNKKEESQTQIAKKYGVTRAAVSKVIVSLKDDLNLPTARHMKSDTARESYRTRALRVHKERKSNLCKTPNSNSYHRLSISRSALMQTLAPAS
jgi:predicted transcriptional regulator